MAMMIIKTNRNFMRMFTVVVIGIDNVTSYRSGSSAVGGSAVRTSLVADGGCSLGQLRRGTDRRTDRRTDRGIA